MRNGHIHPAVFIEVEDGHSASRRQFAVVVEWHASERTLALVFEDRRRSILAGHHEIHGAVIIDVGESGACGGAGSSQARGTGPLGKGGVAIVTPENVWPRPWRGSRPCNEEIEVTVVVKVYERQPGGMIQ